MTTDAAAATYLVRSDARQFPASAYCLVPLAPTTEEETPR